MVEVPTLRTLLEAGVHFGHSKSRRHPKAERFIFTTRDNISIINLEETVQGLKQALQFAEELTAQGKTLLFVGTKRQAKSLVTENCRKAAIPYVAERWVGGLLTNFGMIKRSIDRLISLEEQKTSGGFASMPKQEVSKLEAELLKLKTQFDGIREVKKTPDALFLIDVPNEKTALREAKSLNLPVIGLVDTNADPNLVDYPVPANDDATKALELLISLFIQAVQAGKKRFEEAVLKTAEAKGENK